MKTTRMSIIDVVAQNEGVTTMEARRLVAQRMAEREAKKTRQRELDLTPSLKNIIENLQFIVEEIENDKVHEMHLSLDRELECQAEQLMDLKGQFINHAPCR